MNVELTTEGEDYTHDHESSESSEGAIILFLGIAVGIGGE